MSGENTLLGPLTTELSILGHPTIRGNRNILALEGICFEVKEESSVRPVLVFHKSCSEGGGGALVAHPRVYFVVGGALEALP